MTELEKLNDTLNELEKEVNKVKSLSSVIDEVNNTNKKSNSILGKVDESILILTKIKSQYEQHMTESVNNQNALIDQFEKLNIDQINKSKIQFDFFTDSLKTQSAFEEKILNLIQTLKSENTRTLLELEKIMSSKLERNKSDVEVELRKLEKLINEHFIEANKNNESLAKRNVLFMSIIAVLVLSNIVIQFLK